MRTAARLWDDSPTRGTEGPERPPRLTVSELPLPLDQQQVSRTPGVYYVDKWRLGDREVTLRQPIMMQIVELIEQLRGRSTPSVFGLEVPALGLGTIRGESVDAAFRAFETAIVSLLDAPSPSSAGSRDLFERLLRYLPEQEEHWARPCEAQFEYWAEHRPAALAEFLGRDENPGLLARAAWAAGRVHDPSLVHAALLRLLESGEPLAQEGAVYGLAAHLDDAARSALRRVIEAPGTSSGVREAAIEALEQ